MDYTILGVNIQRDIAHNTGRILTTDDGKCITRVFVAWQSNQPDLPFLWRCTSSYVFHFPITDHDLQNVAARGKDVEDKSLVKSLFPFFPIGRLTD